MISHPKFLPEKLPDYTSIMEIIKNHFNSSKDEHLRDYRRKFKWLNDLTTVKYERHDEMKLEQIKCCFCNLIIPNQLMILVHLELVHTDVAMNYYINERCMIIKRQEKVMDSRGIAVSNNPVNSVFGDFTQRISALLDKLLGKLSKGEHSQSKTIFYHTANIFEEKKEGLDEEDSSDDCEDIMGDIRQIERDRIEDFVDINKNEKELFILWNTYARGVRVTYGNNHMFRHNELIQQLKGFLKDDRLKPLRTSFLVHLNVLWSYGKISSNDILELIHEFDKYHCI